MDYSKFNLSELEYNKIRMDCLWRDAKRKAKYTEGRGKNLIADDCITFEEFDMVLALYFELLANLNIPFEKTHLDQEIILMINKLLKTK